MGFHPLWGLPRGGRLRGRLRLSAPRFAQRRPQRRLLLRTRAASAVQDRPGWVRVCPRRPSSRRVGTAVWRHCRTGRSWRSGSGRLSPRRLCSHRRRQRGPGSGAWGGSRVGVCVPTRAARGGNLDEQRCPQSVLFSSTPFPVVRASAAVLSSLRAVWVPARLSCGWVAQGGWARQQQSQAGGAEAWGQTRGPAHNARLRGGRTTRAGRAHRVPGGGERRAWPRPGTARRRLVVSGADSKGHRALWVDLSLLDSALLWEAELRPFEVTRVVAPHLSGGRPAALAPEAAVGGVC